MVSEYGWGSNVIGVGGGDGDGTAHREELLFVEFGVGDGVGTGDVVDVVCCWCCPLHAVLMRVNVLCFDVGSKKFCFLCSCRLWSALYHSITLSPLSGSFSFSVLCTLNIYGKFTSRSIYCYGCLGYLLVCGSIQKFNTSSFAVHFGRVVFV